MNMVGSTAAESISEGALKSVTGQETFLNRRAYLAKHAALSAVPQLVTGWRVPGSRATAPVEGLRKAAGVPEEAISKNPSYREIVHAATVDRFNSGKYAIGQITDESAIEMEKLMLDAFYLMQLRDYYELLERTALALAVEVSLMADDVPLPNVNTVVPLK